jgi:hypothetical protein
MSSSSTSLSHLKIQGQTVQPSAQPGKTGGARADLETLRAAINHHAKENLRYGNGRADLAGRRLPRHVGRDD